MTESSAGSSPPIAPAPRGRVLLVDASSSFERLAASLRPLVAELTVRPHVEEISDGDYDLVAVNYDALTDGERQTLAASSASARPRRTRLLMVTNSNLRPEFPKLFASGSLTNLVATNDAPEPQALLITVEKILGSDLFGLEKYLPAGGVPLELRIRSSAQKAEVVRAAEAYAAKHEMNTRVAAHLTTIVDELVTNAVFNAPTDAAGNHRYAHLPRTDVVELAAGEEVTLRLCCDGRQLGVSVSDPFGSLSEQRVLEYLAKCFRKESDQVDRKAGGAGLGLFYIFDAVSHFIINIRPKRRTEMIGLLNLTNSYRKFVTQSKSFNIFVSG